jgi:poly-gamma-glutamate capsule biosynthesis protein CapA/YwtB (metallophosphatase superfamily)
MSNTGTGTVSLVGDVMIRRPFAQSGRGAAPGFRAAVAALRETDLAVANLEMPLSRRGSRVPKHSNLRSDPDVIRDVRAMGVHAVTLANNHLCDYGPDALHDTVAACREAGIACCGAGADLEAALAPARLCAGGIPVAVLSVSSTLPVESAARAGKPGIAPIEVACSYEPEVNLTVEQPGTMPRVHTWASRADRETVCARIAALRAEGQAVIVAIHWGVPEHWMSPFQGRLAEYQQPLGRALIDAGAEIVLGHHSHSLHPVEVYRGKPIFYSVGNFLFEDPRDLMAPESVIVQLALGPDPAVTLVPAVLDAEGFPQLAAGQTARRVLALLAERSSPFGTRFEIEGDRARLLLA